MVMSAGFQSFPPPSAPARRRWLGLAAAGICAAVLHSAPADAAVILFADDFNRPDSAVVGNGWTSVGEGGVPGTFVIQDGKLINPDVPRSGIYRPFTFDAPIRITAKLFDSDGHPSAGLGGTYESAFAVRATEDIVQKGYGITVNRNDALGDNSFLSLFDNGVQLEIIDYPDFLITAEAIIDVVFDPDGTIAGSLINPLNSDQFDFAFGPRSIASTGDNFMVVLTGNGRPNYDLQPVNLPGLDDLVIQSVDVPVPGMALLLTGALLLLARRKMTSGKSSALR